MTARQGWRIGIAAAAIAVVTGCTEGAGLPGLLAAPTGEGAAAAAPRTVERDVDSPEVFEVKAEGLWDGRPSLGGIWVAHPSVKDPERVRITNTATGKAVEGALFRREREVPGPAIQVSAEAAAAIGLLAGQPTDLHVVALRRVAVEIAPEPAADEAAAPVAAAAVPVPPDARPKARPARAAAPAAAAAVAPDAIATAARAVEVAEAEAAAAPPVAETASRLARPWLQLGTFTDEANARAMAEQVTADGLSASVADGTHDGKPIWRVLVGPAANRAELRALTRQAGTLGFADAYPVAR
jgi:cell division septation protein DedD